jgi:hypothetical protein
MPSQYASVVACSSRAVSRAAPPPLPEGERGFVPQVRGAPSACL